MRRFEFRSDTMTLPTPAMRKAMAEAQVGDDGVEEDPTVNKLQELAAEMMGMEAALFVPSGTFGNQCAIGTHTATGDEVILSETAHVIEYEGGAAAALWGVQPRTICPQGAPFLTAQMIESRLRLTDDIHEPKTGLVILENALAYGQIMPIAEMQQVRKLTQRYSIPIHLDGARLFNAALALKVPPQAITAEVDSVMFCLSKGLGAPVGSMLCGSSQFIFKARKKRKMMGGGMRQVGVLAAPGIIALTEGVTRLQEDHNNAQLLARLLLEIPGIAIDISTVQTNLVFCHVIKKGYSNGQLVEQLASQGFDTYPPSSNGIRFVISSSVDANDVAALASVIKDCLK